MSSLFIKRYLFLMVAIIFESGSWGLESQLSKWIITGIACIFAMLFVWSLDWKEK